MSSEFTKRGAENSVPPLCFLFVPSQSALLQRKIRIKVWNQNQFSTLLSVLRTDIPAKSESGTLFLFPKRTNEQTECIYSAECEKKSRRRVKANLCYINCSAINCDTHKMSMRSNRRSSTIKSEREQRCNTKSADKSIHFSKQKRNSAQPIFLSLKAFPRYI